MRCVYCGAVERSNAACEKGHFVCDGCHSGTANDLIQRYCGASTSTAPVSMAAELMRSPKFSMHGPEHHYLVPAVLLAAVASAQGKPAADRVKWLATARRRAEDVKGGVCGLHGSCGAGIGTGIAVSVLTGATPLSIGEWRLANLITSESLREIAEHGGPRCCKRDTFLALRAAAGFLEREMGIALDAEGPVVCGFSDLNRECLLQNCPFFPAAGTRGASGT
jgi:hypothetical protein